MTDPEHKATPSEAKQNLLNRIGKEKLSEAATATRDVISEKLSGANVNISVCDPVFNYDIFVKDNVVTIEAKIHYLGD